MKAVVAGLMLIALPPAARAQSLDYGLLVGTWSEPGRCATSLRLFTGDGRYVWLQDSGDGWELAYAGVYVTWGAEEAREAGVRGAVVIAEGLDMGGFLFEVTALSEDRLVLTERGSEDPGEEGGGPSVWVRCPLR